MHVLIAGLYAATVYCALLAYVVIVGGPIVAFLALSPVIISAAIVAILVLDFAVWCVTKAWRRWRPAQGAKPAN